MMPRGRPPSKRPGESPESPLDESSTPSKLPRLGPDDYSSVVKDKLKSYTRTGQACDRCKVRKIRCDGAPEGCSSCASQGLECNVTDRVTGRTERRGYLQELERQKAEMLSYIRGLEKLLRDQGVEVQPYQAKHSLHQQQPAAEIVHNHPPNGGANEWTQVGSVRVRSNATSSLQDRKPPPYPAGYSRAATLQSRPADSHLGVFSDSPTLHSSSGGFKVSSSIKGTQLSVLGKTIDITHFDAPDMDNDPPGTHGHAGLYNKSLRAFLRSATNNNPRLENVELPNRREAFEYSEWYFLMVFPFVPILHKPTYMNLLKRIYDEPGFKPTTSELVIVHMVFAAIYFQYGVRNREEQNRQTHLNDLSDKHYHWSLSHFYELATDNDVTSVQALCMVGSHTRSFPKPGCGSQIAFFTLNKAVELNLHREMKVPPGTPGGTNLENEVRRRAWWSALSLLITLNGRLGKPMPMTLEEFDTDFPIAIPDDYLTDEGITDLSKIGACSWMVGLAGFKITPLYMEMYSNLYSVRRDPRRYVDIVLGLEAQHREWEENLSDDLKVEKVGSQIAALYTQAFSLELTLCLRHPSVCMTTDPKFCAENTRVCEEVARKLLVHCRELLRLKSLDTTWYQVSVYLAAMFCTLVAHWERRFDTTAAQLAALKEDMESWMAIVTEIGLLIGTSSGDHLSNEVELIVSRTLGIIEHDMNNGNSSPPIKHEFPVQHPPPTNNGGVPQSEQPDRPPNAYFESPMQQPPQPGFPISYPDPPAVPVPGNAPPNAIYNPAENTYLYAAAAQDAQGAAPDSTSNNPLNAFATQAAQLSPHGPDGFVHGNVWHEWNMAVAAQSSQQDRYGAGALLGLQGGGHHRSLLEPTGPDGAGSGAEMSGVGGANAPSHSGQWPLLLFHGQGVTRA